MQVASDCLVITVQTRAELDAALNEAVDLLRPMAMTEQVGISVTRLAPARFEVCLDSEVPCGTTGEKWGGPAMSHGRSGGSSESTGGVSQSACAPSDLAACSLRRAAVDVAWRRNGSKNSLTRCEIEDFLSLARGQRVAVKDHETGELWRGSVDTTFPDRGYVWVFTDLGERKLLDISVHTVWRPNKPRACGNVGSEAGK